MSAGHNNSKVMTLLRKLAHKVEVLPLGFLDPRGPPLPDPGACQDRASALSIDVPGIVTPIVILVVLFCSSWHPRAPVCCAFPRHTLLW